MSKIQTPYCISFLILIQPTNALHVHSKVVLQGLVIQVDESDQKFPPIWYGLPSFPVPEHLREPLDLDLPGAELVLLLLPLDFLQALALLRGLLVAALLKRGRGNGGGRSAEKMQGTQGVCSRL